jgi:transcriptional regulator with XRE-family HTH domain
MEFAGVLAFCGLGMAFTWRIPQARLLFTLFATYAAACVLLYIVPSAIGENVARLRREQGISQEDLSVMASVHQTEISGVERGLRVIRIDTLVKLAAALGVSPAALLEGIEWTPGSVQLGGFEIRRQDIELPPELPRGRKPAPEEAGSEGPV